MERIVVGIVRRPHGLSGELQLQIETDFPEQLFVAGRAFGVEPGVGRGDGPRLLTLESARPYTRGWLVKFREADDRDAAEGLRGSRLLLPREELSEPEKGEFFLHELVGLEVRDEGGELVGEVEAVYEATGRALLGVRHEGRERLIPFSSEFVAEVDRDAGRIRIRPPEGLLEL
ncbi:MAG: ribosome maturation factor RimM [Gemmatimonadota bacterium]